MQTYWVRAGLCLFAVMALQAARKEFWETKDPASWTKEEKEIILFQSPWARDGFARMVVEKKRQTEPGYTSEGKRDTGMPDLKPTAEPGGTRAVPIGQEIPPVPNNDPGPPVEFHVLARWETASPVRLAGGPEVPEATGQFYVLRLRGLPLMPPPKVKKGETPVNPNEGMLIALKRGSTLERKDKPPIACDHLFTGTGEHQNEVLMFFPKDGDNAITAADKVVTLESRFVPFRLSIKFPVKDMLYKGQLTL